MIKEAEMVIKDMEEFEEIFGGDHKKETIDDEHRVPKEEILVTTPRPFSQRAPAAISLEVSNLPLVRLDSYIQERQNQAGPSQQSVPRQSRRISTARPDVEQSVSLNESVSHPSIPSVEQPGTVAEQQRPSTSPLKPTARRVSEIKRPRMSGTHQSPTGPDYTAPIAKPSSNMQKQNLRPFDNSKLKRSRPVDAQQSGGADTSKRLRSATDQTVQSLPKTTVGTGEISRTKGNAK